MGLSEFDFDVKHRKGEQNRNADFMSRWAATSKEAYTNWERQNIIRTAVEEDTKYRGSGPTNSKLLVMQETKDEESGKEQMTAATSENMRKLIADEQRKDPMLMKIRSAIEAAKAVVKQLLVDQQHPEEGKKQSSEEPQQIKEPKYRLIGQEELLAQRLIIKTPRARQRYGR